MWQPRPWWPGRWWFFFKKPVNDILLKVVGGELAGAWSRYMRFVFYVTAIGGGTRIWALERYFFPAPGADGKIPAIPEVTTEFLVFKICRTILDTLTSLAWVLFAFFAITLVVYVAIRIFKNKTTTNRTTAVMAVE